MALLDLSLLYGNRISLHGINRSPEHGQTATTKAIAIQLGRHTAEELKDVPPPRIHYFDASAQWPLAPDSFDVVYSQHAFLWIEDKVNALLEMNRVLSRDGIALLDLQFKRSGSVRRNSILIQDGARELPFWEVAQSRAMIEQRAADGPEPSLFERFIHWALRVSRLWKAPNHRRRVRWAMRKVAGLDFGLEFRETRTFGGELIPGREGVQSVYRFKRS